MHNYKTLIVTLALHTMIVGCQSLPQNEKPICSDQDNCVEVTGELDYANTTQGNLFLLKTEADQPAMCVALSDDLSEERVKKYEKHNVTVMGEKQNLTEFPNCAFIKYGNTNIPCGYCNGSVFLAKQITPQTP